MEEDELVDPDPEVPEMGMGDEDGILMPKDSKELGFDETDPESGLKETTEEEEEMQ
ncbi:MAG: hypothetical protein ABIG73_00915 [Patescibacteria group bacterium]